MTSEFRSRQQVIGVVQFFLEALDLLLKLGNGLVSGSVHPLQILLKGLVGCGKMKERSIKHL